MGERNATDSLYVYGARYIFITARTASECITSVCVRYKNTLKEFSLLSSFRLNRFLIYKCCIIIQLSNALSVWYL